MPDPSDVQTPDERTLTVRDLVESRSDSLKLDILTPEIDLDREVLDGEISSPGLALAGFTERFPGGRMQVFGETEMSYLGSLGEDERREKLTRLFEFDIPALFVTKALSVPDLFLELAASASIPVLRSALGTREFYRRVKPFLESALALTTTLHGSLADVYGVGLLFVGKSGVGKSECVLDLVERGHRLVADDLVMVDRRGHDIILGRGHPLQRHHMEIRGIGIIDIRALFGIRAIRQQKRIEVVVRLEHWDEASTYTRTGLEEDSTEILDVRIPRVTVPLNPGKNITVISEVVAMNHLLRYTGVNSAADFDQTLRASMSGVREYLEQDFE